MTTNVFATQSWVLDTALSGSLIVGSGAPGSGVGHDGQYYLESSTGDVYGPKASGAWPGSPAFTLAGGGGGGGGGGSGASLEMHREYQGTPQSAGDNDTAAMAAYPGTTQLPVGIVLDTAATGTDDVAGDSTISVASNVFTVSVAGLYWVKGYIEWNGAVHRTFTDIVVSTASKQLTQRQPDTTGESSITNAKISYNEGFVYLTAGSTVGMSGNIELTGTTPVPYVSNASLTILRIPFGGGTIILDGAVDPTTEGVDGDYYLNTASKTLFGPKASGSWPTGIVLGGGGSVGWVSVATVDDGDQPGGQVFLDVGTRGTVLTGGTITTASYSMDIFLNDLAAGYQLTYAGMFVYNSDGSKHAYAYANASVPMTADGQILLDTGLVQVGGITLTSGSLVVPDAGLWHYRIVATITLI